MGGVDVVYDAVGGDTWAEAGFQGHAPPAGGHFLVIGFASGDIPMPEINCQPPRL